MNVQVIQVPYDSGNRGLRMGGGPEHFVQNGLVQALQASGHHVSVETIESQSAFRAEVQTQFELYRAVAGRVADVKRNGQFPLILSGNCGASLGAIASNGGKRQGVVWFDAHGEFNTPETTTSGFLDGMGLAVATGLCWQRLAASLPGFHPISGKQILLIGGRDFDDGERERLEQAGGDVIDAAAVGQSRIPNVLQPSIAAFQTNVDEMHLHLDLDVLNPKEVVANQYATGDQGMSVAQVGEAIQYFKDHLTLTSATVASFDPTFDPEGKTLKAGIRLIEQIVNND